MKKFLLMEHSDPIGILIFFASFLSLFFSCDNTTEPPNNNAKLNLTLEDVSCTEVWLKLQVDNPALKSDVIIYRDNLEIKRINNILGNDTIIYDEGLLPNKEYTYRAKKIISESESIESEEIKAQTMDTTSHNFTFETFTFGEHSSSVLYDVAIIDENNIWAVGEIYMNDSLGNPDPNAFNCVHWDGNLWTPHRIQFYTFCPERTGRGSYPANSILAFDEKNIWITSGSQITHYDGEKQTYLECIPVSAIKMWGTNNNDIYVVGVQGGIAHYQNGVWRKIESGTELNIGDICGVKNNDYYNKYCAVGDYMLKIDNNDNVSKISKEEGMYINSVWGKSNKLIYTAGNGVVLYKNNKWEKINREDVNKIYGIWGENYNNLFGISTNRLVLHFNGYSWYSTNTGFNNTYIRLNVTKNLLAAIGWRNEKAIITIGRR